MHPPTTAANPRCHSSTKHCRITGRLQFTLYTTIETRVQRLSALRNHVAHQVTLYHRFEEQVGQKSRNGRPAVCHRISSFAFLSGISPFLVECPRSQKPKPASASPLLGFLHLLPCVLEQHRYARNRAAEGSLRSSTKHQSSRLGNMLQLHAVQLYCISFATYDQTWYITGFGGHSFVQLLFYVLRTSARSTQSGRPPRALNICGQRPTYTISELKHAKFL